jgi:methyl-accepting chemotaxis protein
MSMHGSLRAQLLTLLGGSLLLIVIISLFCFRLLAQGVEDYRGLVNSTLEESGLVDKANLEFKIQVQEWKNVLLRGKEPQALAKYWSQFEEQEQLVQKTLAQLTQVATQWQDEELLTQIRVLSEEHQKLGQAYRVGKDKFLAAQADPYVGDLAVKGIDRATSEQMAALVEQLHAEGKTSAQRISDSTHADTIVGVSVLVIASLLVGLLGLWLVNRQLLVPIKALTDYISLLSHGKFDRPLIMQRQDELGALARAANTLRDFLAATFSQLKLSGDQLNGASHDLKQIAGLMITGTREQFSRTDMVATAMHEMSATAQNVAENAASAAQAADQADQTAREGEQVMQATIGGITQMGGEIDNTAGVINRLDEDSRRISTVLEVIRAIAEQTNLLALNAAIEAARAGEQGRGFAVVADEVRTLAKRTADSTAEINQIINKVQRGTQDAVQAIHSSQRLSTQSVDQVTLAGSKLQSIAASISQIHNMNQQIATAAEEQTLVVEDIARNLVDIKTIAGENEENAQRTQGASEQLHLTADDLNKAMQKLLA